MTRTLPVTRLTQVVTVVASVMGGGEGPAAFAVVA
jgi:hypothetical protein